MKKCYSKLNSQDVCAIKQSRRKWTPGKRKSMWTGSEVGEMDVFKEEGKTNGGRAM